MPQHEQSKTSNRLGRSESSAPSATRGLLHRLLYMSSGSVGLLQNRWSIPVNFHYASPETSPFASVWPLEISQHSMQSERNTHSDSEKTGSGTRSDSQPKATDVFSFNLPELDWVLSQEDIDEVPIPQYKRQRTSALPDARGSTSTQRFSTIQPSTEMPGAPQQTQGSGTGLPQQRSVENEMPFSKPPSRSMDTDNNATQHMHESAMPTTVGNIQIPGVSASENTSSKKTHAYLMSDIANNTSGANQITGEPRDNLISTIQRQVFTDSHPSVAPSEKRDTAHIETTLDHQMKTPTAKPLVQSQARQPRTPLATPQINDAAQVSMRHAPAAAEASQIRTQRSNDSLAVDSLMPSTPAKNASSSTPHLSSEAATEKLHEVMSQWLANAQSGEHNSNNDETNEKNERVAKQAPPQVMRYVTVQRYTPNRGGTQTMFWQRSYLPRLTTNLR